MNNDRYISIDRLRELFFVDESGNLIRIIPTKMSRSGSIAGYKRKDGRIEVYVDKRRFFVHRIVFAITHGHFPKDQIDHIDGNPSNNLPSNLRECSNTENQQNVGLRIDSTSGLIGVCFLKQAGKWKAEIKNNKKHVYLGTFNTKHEAHAAYLFAKSMLHNFQPVPRTCQK